MKLINVSQQTKSALLACGIAVYGLLACQPVFANPIGGAVVGGAATITGQGTNYVEINQTTHRAAINWQSFNIGHGETTRINQPSSSSISLNRVVGSNPSHIFGHLQSNGHVWLVNPAGVIFGPTSRVDVGSLLVATANIETADFMKGNYRFKQTPGNNSAIVAQGTIVAADSGIVALVAPGVENSGVIEARMGKVALASGTEYTVDLYGDQLINFVADSATPTQRAVTPDGRELPNAVSHTGTIMADGGTVLMTAKAARQVVNNTINMTGVIQARGAMQGKGGEIILLGGEQGKVNVNGKLDVSSRGTGGKGGKIRVTGEDVALVNATLDASGDAGGGEVFVGGGAYGKDTSMMNAKTLKVDKDSRLLADALIDGDGGRVIAWSDQQTDFLGHSSAQGGVNGGDGGFIETSGHILNFKGTVDAHSPHGKAGTALFDPWALIINGTTIVSNPQNDVSLPQSGSPPVDANTISLALNSGSNVVLQATGSITINGDITALNPTTGTLTLTANTIVINSIINVTNGVYVVGSGDNATLSIPLTISEKNTWNVTGNNSGTATTFTFGSANTAMNFSNISNLVGGAKTDNFIFSGSGRLSGSIDGGGGTNTLNLSGMTNPNVSLLSVTFTSPLNGFIFQGSARAVVLGGFRNIQTLIPALPAAVAPGYVNGVNTANATLQQTSNGDPFGDPHVIEEKLQYFIYAYKAGLLTEEQIADYIKLLSGLMGRTVTIC